MRWWLGAVRFDGFTGALSGPPEWPCRGGILRQPGKLAEAHEVLLEEWPHVQRGRAPKVDGKPAEENPEAEVPKKPRRPRRRRGQ